MFSQLQSHGDVAFAIAIIAFFLVIWMVLRDYHQKYVAIGLSDTMDKSKRHGVIHLETVEGGVTQLPFLADRPDRLKEPANYTVRKMFEQVSKMGFFPRHLEIHIDGRASVFEFNSKTGGFKKLFEQQMPAR